VITRNFVRYRNLNKTTKIEKREDVNNGKNGCDDGSHVEAMKKRQMEEPKR
jgi:hypothetical protein